MNADEWMRAMQLNPDDNNVRLQYADWLEDTGDVERARFIRMSIERNMVILASSPISNTRDSDDIIHKVFTDWAPFNSGYGYGVDYGFSDGNGKGSEDY